MQKILVKKSTKTREYLGGKLRFCTHSTSYSFNGILIFNFHKFHTPEIHRQKSLLESYILLSPNKFMQVQSYNSYFQVLNMFTHVHM